MVSLDTETTGIDLKHDARPFLVTTCDDQDEVRFWEWNVDPLTRMPEIPPEDIREIGEFLFADGPNGPGPFVLQNAKFDFAALKTIGMWDEQGWGVEHVWPDVLDTLIAGHLLASNQPHDLTTMALVYLGINIEPYEEAMRLACTEARRIARSRFPSWKIAKEGVAGMPSIKGSGSGGGRDSEKDKLWKNDTWLPRCIARELNYADDHPWWTVTSEYANFDSMTTLKLWQVQEEELKKNDLWEIYLDRLKLLPVIYGMEQKGVTISRDRSLSLKKQYVEQAMRHHADCITLAEGKIETLPVSGVSNALWDVVFNHFALESPKKTKKGAESMDKYVLDEWLITLDAEENPHKFVKNLKAYRARKTAIGFIESYEKFWIRYGDVYRLHMNLNPTGTDTLRFSCSNPNGQQISKKEIKQEEGQGRNAKWMFGPAPGREWWAIDYENIELRIPAYEAGEELMIQLFERPDDPPYFGSNHLLYFDILHPEMFAKHGKDVKEIFADTWYQWTKNGDFAVLYGAIASSGTADRAYHVVGGQAKIEGRLKKIKKLSQYYIEFANKHGYVETIPDKNLSSVRGYPLTCSRSFYGKVSPTVPLSYHVQGTAMQCTAKAMVRCQEYLNELNEDDPRGYFIALQIHDEMVFDFPLGGRRNLARINNIKRLMEKSGDDIGVPLKAAVSYHPNNWMEKVKI